MTAFETYTRMMLESSSDLSGGESNEEIQRQIDAWEAVKKEMGQKEAIWKFWEWQKTLSPDIRMIISCDPDGGIGEDSCDNFDLPLSSRPDADRGYEFSIR